MKYITYYHGFPTRLGNKNTGWVSCYQWKPFGLRWISAILVWAYHNILCYQYLLKVRYADEVVCVSESSRQELIKNAKKFGFKFSWSL